MAYVRNRLPHSTLGCSPFEKLTGKKPLLKYVGGFGCRASVYNEQPKLKFYSNGRPDLMLECTDHGEYPKKLLHNMKTVEWGHVPFGKTSFPALERRNSSNSSGEDEQCDENASGNDKSNNLVALSESRSADDF